MTALRDMPEGLSSEKKLETFLTDLAASAISRPTMGYLHAESLSVPSPLETALA